MTNIVEIHVSDIKHFVKRARPSAPFQRMKESIKREGLKMPIQVRKVRGGYELVCGQGRLQAFRELRRETIPAIVLDVPEREIVGRFLAENVMRRKLSWQEKARLIQRDFRRIGEPSKADIEAIAAHYFITPAHVAKLLKILQQASPKVRETLDDLTVEEAGELTSLPAAGQEIVVETMKEEAIPASNVGAVVRRAKELTQDSGELSKTALKQSLRRVNEDLERQRKQLKLYRLHWQLGPSNLQMLLSDKAFRRAVAREGINVSKFEETI